MWLTNSQPVICEYWSCTTLVPIWFRVQNELRSSEDHHESLKQSSSFKSGMFIHGWSKWERIQFRQVGRVFIWVRVWLCRVCMYIEDRSQPYTLCFWNRISWWPIFGQLVYIGWKHSPEILLSPPNQHWNSSPLHDASLFTWVLETKIRTPSSLAGPLRSEISLDSAF